MKKFICIFFLACTTVVVFSASVAEPTSSRVLIRSKKISHENQEDVMSKEDEEEDLRWLETYEVLANVLNCKNNPAILSFQSWCYIEPEVVERRPKGIVNIMKHRQFLCSPKHIELINVKEKICHDFEANIEEYKDALTAILKEMGLESFSSTPMSIIYDKVEKTTGLSVTFVKDEIVELMFQIIEENYVKMARRY